MTRFDTAAGLFGKGRLADELCITVPTLNFNINRDRGESDPNIPDVAAARRSRGEQLPAHARKLREAKSLQFAKREANRSPKPTRPC